MKRLSDVPGRLKGGGSITELNTDSPRLETGHIRK